ncbi:hypothetical protein AB0F42_26180 [Streptomyces buecherae]|uniref:hypothetical protein n=1 Tax=Streptomyces buecherae TaxID=2763006 RepID=UPI00340995BA
MSRERPSTMDGDLHTVFGHPVPALYEAADLPGASPALIRALTLRSFLAVTEEQIDSIRDRVHADMAPDRDMSELSADKLHVDAQWLAAALDVRDGYRAALGELLRTMLPPHQRARPPHMAHLMATASPPPSSTAPAPLPHAGATRTRRP